MLLILIKYIFFLDYIVSKKILGAFPAPFLVARPRGPGISGVELVGPGRGPGIGGVELVGPLL